MNPQETYRTEPIPPVSLTIDVPSPYSGKLFMERGVWVQCEVTFRSADDSGLQAQARRIYVDDEGFPEALYQLLCDMAEPSRLPVWKRGEAISGCRPE